MILLALPLLFTSCQTGSDEQIDDAPKRLSQQLGNAVLWFQQSAEMQTIYLQRYQHAKLLLKQKLDTLNPNQQAAIVLDIDETILDNSPYEARLLVSGTNYATASWKSWCEEAKASALPGAIDFLNFADQNGVNIFYISNRKVNVLQATIANLKTVGAPQVDTLTVMLRTNTSNKTARRTNVKNEYQVLLYVGDNLTDYDEDFAKRGKDKAKILVEKRQQELFANFIMLPNPMYGEWEAALYDNDFNIADSLKLLKRKDALYLAD